MKLNRLKRLSPRRLGLKSRLLLAVIVIVGISLLIFLRNINSPAYGTISVPQTINPVLTDTTDYTTLSNEYFSALYPSQLTPDLPDQKPADALVYSYFSKKNETQNLSDSLEIYVTTLPIGGVTIDSNYRNYQSQPKLYQLSQKYIRGEVVDVATRDDGTHERAGLWVHGKYLLIVKFKGQSKDEVESKFTTILKSIQWLKS